MKDRTKWFMTLHVVGMWHYYSENYSSSQSEIHNVDTHDSKNILYQIVHSSSRISIVFRTQSARVNRGNEYIISNPLHFL
jgi:hypothetical protein